MTSAEASFSAESRSAMVATPHGRSNCTTTARPSVIMLNAALSINADTQNTLVRIMTIPANDGNHFSNVDNSTESPRVNYRSPPPQGSVHWPVLKHDTGKQPAARRLSSTVPLPTLSTNFPKTQSMCVGLSPGESTSHESACTTVTEDLTLNQQLPSTTSEPVEMFRSRSVPSTSPLPNSTASSVTKKSRNGNPSGIRMGPPRLTRRRSAVKRAPSALKSKGTPETVPVHHSKPSPPPLNSVDIGKETPGHEESKTATPVKEVMSVSISALSLDEPVCCICLDGYGSDNPRCEGTCGHHFHIQCLISWKQRSNKCPLCCAESLKGIGEPDLTTKVGPKAEEDLAATAETQVHIEGDAAYAMLLQQKYIRRAQRRANEHREQRQMLSQQQQQPQRVGGTNPVSPRFNTSSGATPRRQHLTPRGRHREEIRRSIAGRKRSSGVCVVM